MQCRMCWSVPVSLVAVMAIISIAATQEDNNILENLLEPHNIEIRSRNRFCGQRLTKALQLICNSFYYSPQKRTTLDDLSFFRRGTDQDPPYLNKKLVASMFTKRQYTLRGVADECCKKGCSYGELSSYCGERR